MRACVSQQRYADKGARWHSGAPWMCFTSHSLPPNLYSSLPNFRFGLGEKQKTSRKKSIMAVYELQQKEW